MNAGRRVLLGMMMTTAAMTNAAMAASLPAAAAAPAMPGFDGATTWFNSAPLTPRQLRGKVVLVDFWTYSCINCIRTIPYVRAWADKYRAQGLVVVGVHTPEFGFEEDLGNVNAAVARFGIGFPVAVDSRRRIWEAWGNRAWPAWYLVDANGRIRHQQLGEGGYDKLELAIRSGPGGGDLVAPVMRDEQAPPDLGNLRSEETYVGYRRASNVMSPERLRADMAQAYSVGQLGLNEWGLSGPWTVRAEFATAGQGGGLAYRFSARDLHLVAGAGGPGRTVRINVTLDGRPPGPDHGADTDADGNGVLGATRLYQLIRQSGTPGPRRFEIRFLDAGAQAYAFTFG
jgi:thiol-disulfide isomerase/thioredoxin